MTNNETTGQFRDKAYTGTIAGRDRRSAPSLATQRIKLDFYCLVEMLAVAIAGLAIAHVYVGGILEVDDYFQGYAYPLILLPLSLGLILHRAGQYELQSVTDFAGSLGVVAGAVLGAFATFAILAVIFGVADNYSRVWFGGWLIASLVVLWLVRAIAARVFSRWLASGAMGKRVVVLGTGPEVDHFLAHFEQDNPHLQMVGRFWHEGGSVGATVRDELDKLIEDGRSGGFDVVVIAPSYRDPAELDWILNAISMLSVEVKILPPQGIAHISLLGISQHDGRQFIDLQRSRVSDWGRLFKLAEDYLIALAAVVLLSWLLLIIATAIRLESAGPVLYRQARTGLNNKEFQIYKFRTMRAEPEGTAFRQTARGDDRITRVGRFLRRTSLDELPQLFNVLRGEMSIVGPRPHPVELNGLYAPNLHLFNRRHSVKPGITGWAQVHDHRGPIEDRDDMLKRLNYDLYYVENWSPWLDLKIIAATPLMSLIHRNAV